MQWYLSQSAHGFSSHFITKNDVTTLPGRPDAILAAESMRRRTYLTSMLVLPSLSHASCAVENITMGIVLCEGDFVLDVVQARLRQLEGQVPPNLHRRCHWPQ